MDLVPGMSVYSRVGHDRKHMRLLYMNRQALSVWVTMVCNHMWLGHNIVLHIPQCSSLAGRSENSSRQLRPGE